MGAPVNAKTATKYGIVQGAVVRTTDGRCGKCHGSEFSRAVKGLLCCMTCGSSKDENWRALLTENERELLKARSRLV